MLYSILAEFQAQPGPLSVSELSHRLCVPESALEGMLSTLAGQGRLQLVDGTSGPCELCPLTTLCGAGSGQRAYMLSEKADMVCACAPDGAGT
ncbi:MAG: helix-turn-helix domain-containing protein [Caldilineales bacterium]|nr:helix-turn-helix domain-containing protein [Caldilineales bacterium]